MIDRTETASAAVADQFIPIAPRRDFEAFWILRALAKGIELDDAKIEAETGVARSIWASLLDRIKKARYGVLLYGGDSRDSARATSIIMPGWPWSAT